MFNTQFNIYIYIHTIIYIYCDMSRFSYNFLSILGLLCEFNSWSPVTAVAGVAWSLGTAGTFECRLVTQRRFFETCRKIKKCIMI